MEKEKLRVWHIPQVPMKAFYVDVKTVEEAIKVLRILAYYDLFQYENNVKPDYCNVQGLLVCDEAEKDWVEWYDDEGNDIHEYERDVYEPSAEPELIGA